MTATHPQLFVHFRRPLSLLRQVVPLVLVVVGLVLVGHALYLGLQRPGFLGGIPLGQFLPGFQLLLGVAIGTAGVLDRRGNVIPVLSTLLLLGVLVVLTGPAAPLSLGVVQWTVLTGVVFVCVGLPAVLLTAVERYGREASVETPVPA